MGEASDEPDYRDERWLRERYIGQQIPIKEIAESCGVHHQTIWRWLKRNGIPRRTLSEARGGDTRLHDREWVLNQYWGERLSTREIAEKCDVSHDTVLYWMRKHDIKRRSKTEAFDTPEELMDPDWLREHYIELWETSTEIAENIESSPTVVIYWLNKHGIPVRGMSEYSGKRSPFWGGGHRTYYGPNWNDEREAAIQRDNEKCIRCGMPREAHREVYGRDLHVHHINKADEYRREDGTIDHEEANKLSNLLTTCYDCHPGLEGIPFDTRSLNQ